MTHEIDRLHEAVLAQRQGAGRSRTARLLRAGLPKMAKKLVEEAAEVALDAVQGRREEAVQESADLVYNLVVLWAGAGIAPEDVWAELARRRALLGLAEKLPKAARHEHPANDGSPAPASRQV